MSKMRFTDKYYTTERIVQYNCTYNVVFGERSDGKTTAVLLEQCLEQIKHNPDFQFVYLRRFEDETRETSMNLMIQQNKFLQKKAFDLFGEEILFSHRKGGFYLKDSGKVLGYVLNIQKGHLKKSVPMENVGCILLDEFITSTYYIEDEIQMFFNIVSSIVRHRKNVKIFLCGNTLRSIYTCPYFEAFGIDRKRLKQGFISVVKHKKGACVAVEWCRSMITPDKSESSSMYFGFDDDKTGTLQMITQGTFEAYSYTTQEVDGVFWNVKDRILVPLYVSGLESVFEITYKMNKGFPIFFVRKINTQQGKVKKDIKFNLALDDMTLVHNDGSIVPRFQAIVPLMGQGVVEMLSQLFQCQQAGRCLYDDIDNATEFNEILKEIRSRC